MSLWLWWFSVFFAPQKKPNHCIWLLTDEQQSKYLWCLNVTAAPLSDLGIAFLLVSIRIPLHTIAVASLHSITAAVSVLLIPNGGSSQDVRWMSRTVILVDYLGVIKLSDYEQLWCEIWLSPNILPTNILGCGVTLKGDASQCQISRISGAHGALIPVAYAMRTWPWI